MNILRAHNTATDHFGDFIIALFTALKNGVRTLFSSRRDDDDEGYVMNATKRQTSSTRNRNKPRILDAREDRASRRSMRNLLI